MIRLNLMSVGLVEETSSVIVVLRAPDQGRLLVMEVGLLEGRAIAMEAEGVRAPRPLTHDLMQQVVERLGANVAEVLIREFRDKTYYANLVLTKDGGDRAELDCRPSDAIAIALRTGAPIYVADEVLAEAGLDEEEDAVDLDDDEEDADEDDADDEENEDEDPVVH